MMYRLVSGVCSLLLLLSLFSMSFALTTAQEAFTVDYTFTGSEKQLAGFAEGLITITPPADGRTDGYYLLYFANDTAILPSYDEFASIAITGHTVTHQVKEATLIPPKATRLAVFESDERFVKDAPAIDTAVAFIPIPNEKRPSFGAAEASFGAIADVHMNYQAYNRGAYQKWKKALSVFAERKTDFVIVAGDMTGDASDSPLDSQYRKYLDLIAESTYPLENIYEAIGNHGNTAVGRELFVEYTAGADEKHPIDGSAWFSVLKKKKTADARDNLFIFMAQELEAPGDSANGDNFSKEQIDWLASLLDTYQHTDTNIFIVLHAPFVDYGPGDRHGGDYRSSVTFKDTYPQTMRLKSILENHKDVIVMSGHTHLSLYDLENYSDEDGTSCRMIHLGSGCQPTSYGTGLTLERSTDGRRTVTPTYGSEAYTVTVYKDYIVYIGRNLSTGKIIPAASYLLPVKAFPADNSGKADLYDTLRGSGTEKDPYLIEDAADFKLFTDSFNTRAAKENEMFGNGQFFRQTADIDMRSIAGYNGTVSSGSDPYFFAGTYNGDGHTITVNIHGRGERSVFPVVYGTVCNLILKGEITSNEKAQPVRTLYGNVINCLFDVKLTAATAVSGIVYANYGTMYNVYARGTLTAEKKSAIAAADSSFNYVNVFHCYHDDNGVAVNDSYGIYSEDIDEILDIFNKRDTIQHQEAQALIGEYEMTDLVIDDGTLGFEHNGISPTTTTTTAVLAAAPLISLPYSTWVMLLIAGIAVLTVAGLFAWKMFSKKY